MKIDFDLKKKTEKLNDVLHKTGELGKTVASSVQKSVDSTSKAIVSNVQREINVASEKKKNEAYQRRLKKFNPLFLERYQSEDFNLPNMVVIVDEAERRTIDVCQGAIGWLSNDSGMEVMHLYDEAIKVSGLKFLPEPLCDAIYYVDRFDRKQFIRIDCLFSRAQEEKIAELEHIAYSLGAKSCEVEISEYEVEKESSNKALVFSEGITIKGIAASSTEKLEQRFSNNNTSKIRSRGVIEFEGSTEIKYPELKWFKNDDNIKRLIEMRLEGKNLVKSKTLNLEGATTSVMTQKTAYAIDCAVKKIASFKGSSNMESQAIKESKTVFIFKMNF